MVLSPFLARRVACRRFEPFPLSDSLFIEEVILFSTYIISYLLGFCQEVFFGSGYLFLRTLHLTSFLFLFFNYIISYSIGICQELFFRSDFFDFEISKWKFSIPFSKWNFKMKFQNQNWKWNWKWNFKLKISFPPSLSIYIIT